jgi:hypothetical protein
VRSIPQLISERLGRLFESSDAKWARKRRLLGYGDLPPSTTSMPQPTAESTKHRNGGEIGATLLVVYVGGIWVSRAIIVVGCWIYCVVTYGFLLGVGLGWLPSMIAAYLTAWLWPLFVAVVVALVIQVLRS